MAFLGKKTVRGEKRWDGDVAGNARPNSFNAGQVVRWVAVPGVGAALGLWLVGTMAGLSSVGASLSSGGLQQTLLMPGSLALVDPQKQHFVKSPTPFLLANAHGGSLALHDHVRQCGADCFKLASAMAPAEKSGRLVAIVDKTKERFERMQAALSPSRLAAAFADARTSNVADKPVISGIAPQRVAAASLLPPGTVMASLSTDAPDPLAERFARVDAASQVVQTAPQPMRFGQPVSDTPSPSQVALALARPQDAQNDEYVWPLPMTDSEFAPGAAQVAQPDDGVAPPEAASGEVPLPERRPHVDNAQPAPKAAPAPKVAQPSKPAPEQKVVRGQKPVQEPKTVQQARPIQTARQGRPGDGGDVLAYARPDSPAGVMGKAFSNLFSTPRPGNGVAIYDISAKTVYMPDGQRLEAHSGLGAMVDQPRFVSHKDRGPTPPNTYILSLRESRFHGVEALRLTPVSGGNKYGRDGLLAHTYMLRGGRAESNGCVVFRDYARFLAAFKKGKITRLVVVPRLSGSATRVASNARGV